MLRCGLLICLLGVPIAPAWAAPAAPYAFRNATIVAGGFMPGIVFHPTIAGLAYIRSDMGGAYRLDPATRRWQPLLDFTKDYVETGVESIALDAAHPDRVYLACGTTVASWAPNGFLLRSDNRGETWERLPLPFKCGGNSDGRSIGERLLVDPLAPEQLWLGSRQKGLWRSRDRGTTWQPVTSFPVAETSAGRWPGSGVCFVLADPRGSAPGGPTQTLYAGVATQPLSLYRSRDNGGTWTALPGQPTDWLPHHGVLASNGWLYLTYCDTPGPNGVTDSQVWRLDTATDAWTNITPAAVAGQKLGYGYAGLAVDRRQPATVMVGTTCRWAAGDDQWRSIDGGATWRQVGPTALRDVSRSPYLRWGKPETQRVGAGNWQGSIVIDPFNSNRVLYVTGATVWGCDDITNVDRGLPTHWVVRGEGIEQTAVLDLISPPEGPPLISGLGDIGGFVHDDLTVSPQAGMMRPYMTNRALDYAGAAPRHVVRVGDGIAVPGCLSTDSGQTWQVFATAPVAGAKNGSVALSADGRAVLWSPGGQPPFRSTDGGTTWARCQGLETAAVVVADRVDPLLLYALPVNRDDSPARLHRSTDGGVTFQPAAAGLRGRRLRAVPGLTRQLWLAGPTGLWRSTDAGETFTALAGCSSAMSVGFGQAAPGQTHPAVFTAATRSGVTALYRSDDLGGTWLRLNDEQHLWGGLYGCLTGDPRVYGRFYLGTNGRGIIIGEPR
ncbi:MAG: xyloglucanase [Fimbriimonadaceae bacterium]|nr:xyloglucanase [Fimbriimonadaceae bacterium]